MKSVKDKKKKYQKGTVFFMEFWLCIFTAGLGLDLVNAAFGEPLNIISTIISVLYLVLFVLGVYLAKQGKMMAGVIELVVGTIILLNDFLSDKAIGLWGIVGVLLIFQAIVYLYHHRKNK